MKFKVEYTRWVCHDVGENITTKYRKFESIVQYIFILITKPGLLELKEPSQ